MVAEHFVAAHSLRRRGQITTARLELRERARPRDRAL